VQSEGANGYLQQWAKKPGCAKAIATLCLKALPEFSNDLYIGS